MHKKVELNIFGCWPATAMQIQTSSHNWHYLIEYCHELNGAYRPDLPCRISTDWSALAMGAAFEQRRQDGTWQLVACLHRKCNEAESKYSSYKGELRAIAWALEKLRPFVIGKQFEILTDCQSLIHINSRTPVDNKVHRDLEILSQFDYA
eukprot:Lankesteria_metandrocarpae@DN6143_c0_g1_i1.p1